MRWCLGKGRSDLEEVVFEEAGVDFIRVNRVTHSAAGFLFAVFIDDSDRVACESVQEQSAVSELALQPGLVIPARLFFNINCISDLASSASVIIIDFDRPVHVRVLRIENELAKSLDRSDYTLSVSALRKPEKTN